MIYRRSPFLSLSLLALVFVVVVVVVVAAIFLGPSAMSTIRSLSSSHIPLLFLSPCFVRASSDVRPSEKTKTKKDLKERNEEDSLCGLYMDCDGVDSNRTPASSLPFRGFSFVSISFYV